MSEQNPIEGKTTTVTKKISWKYYLIFTSWLFLCMLSFYLGMGLIDWDDSKEKGDAVVQQANLTPEENVPFSKIWDGLFSQEKSDSSESEKAPEKKSAIVLPTDKPIRSSTWFSDYEAMKKVVHLYDEIHPFIYSMKGGLNNTGELANSWSSTNKRERVEELRRLNPNVKIIPTIFRWENPKEKIMENIGMNGRNDIRDKHIQIILNEIETYNFDGIDIDYEGMSCEKKEKFEEFIVLLSKEMKKRNKILSVAVHPKTPNARPRKTICKGSGKEIVLDFNENWRGPMTHDYEFLAKHVDRLKIMAYELHPRKYHNPGPGPQAPNTWLREIIKYSKKRVPSEKLYMAIPTYGYDWALNCKAPAKSVYHSDVQRIKGMSPTLHQPTDINQILNTNPKSAQWTNLTKYSWVHDNKVYEDPSLWYKSGDCDRLAFFMNRKAFEEKMKLLQRYEIGGFSFWQLISDNDPEISDYLELLVTNKLPKVEIANDLYDDEKEIPKDQEGNVVSASKSSSKTHKSRIESNTKVSKSALKDTAKKSSTAIPRQKSIMEDSAKGKSVKLPSADELPTASPKVKPASDTTKLLPLKEDIVYE